MLQKYIKERGIKFKMSEMYKGIGQITTIAFFSSLIMGLLLFFYSVFTDYMYYPLYEAVSLMQNVGVIGSWVATLMNTLQNDILFKIPTFVDILWLIGFIIFTITFIQASYFTKREGYFSTLAFLTFGIMAVLFVSGIFIQLGDWFTQEFTLAVIPNLAYATPFFTLYLNNAFYINLILIILGVIANFIDLDTINFNQRKEKEVIQTNEL